MTQSIRSVMYVVSRFPSVSATFTAHEMEAIAQRGIDIQVSPVWKTLSKQSAHDVEKPFLDRVFETRLHNLRSWLRAAEVLLRQPRLLSVLWQLFLGHLVSVHAMLKFLASVPKGLLLGRWMQHQSIDILHAHFLTSPATVALIASKVSGVPFTVTIHAFDIYSRNAKFINGGVRTKCQHADANVLISQFAQEYIARRWPGLHARFELIYNGIDLDLFKPTVRRRRGPGEFPVRILSNGRLIEKKGHAYLIRAVAKLRAEGVPIELRIIGDGPQGIELRALVEKLGLTSYVQFLGTMTQDAVLREYQACDMFVLACAVAASGDMDGLPTVLIESLALEVPSVSTRVSGVPEIIRDWETGLCVEPHDVDALTCAMRYMIEHPDEAAAMALRGRNLVEARFDRQRTAEALIGLWQDVLQRRAIPSGIAKAVDEDTDDSGALVLS